MSKPQKGKGGKRGRHWHKGKWWDYMHTLDALPETGAEIDLDLSQPEPERSG